jgi:ABC-type maltose transport system permease subunit
METFIFQSMQFFLSTKLSLILGIIAIMFYLWFTFSTVYHFIRFGVGTAPKDLAFTFLVGSLLFFALSIALYSRVEWEVLLAALSELNDVNFYPQ